MVVDTSVLVDHLRGDDRAVTTLASAVRDGHQLWSVTVVRAEILIGMRRGEERNTRVLLGTLRWLDVTPDIADLAGDLGRRHSQANKGIDVMDFIIAAATRRLGARLLTLNVRHFPMFPGLAPAYPPSH